MAETLSDRELASRPVFFERNRVARVYRGGKLFHGFFGNPWTASTTHLVGKRALAAGRKRPRVQTRAAGLVVEALIDTADTPDFAVNRLRLTRGQAVLERASAVHVITGGAGAIHMDGFSRPLRCGEYFFLPAAARGARLATEGRLEVVECLPPAAGTISPAAASAAG